MVPMVTCNLLLIEEKSRTTAGERTYMKPPICVGTMVK